MTKIKFSINPQKLPYEKRGKPMMSKYDKNIRIKIKIRIKQARGGR
jgi:hypothetical protein